MKSLFKILLFSIAVFAFSNVNAQFVTRTAKDTTVNAVTHYLTVLSTADGVTGIEASVTKISGTVAGTLSLEGRIDNNGWTRISDSIYTATNVASQKFIWRVPVQSFNGFRVNYTTSGTQSSSFQVAYLRRATR